MSRKSAKIRRRQKFKRRLALARAGGRTPPEEMHQALGEFLTAMGAMEHRMILCVAHFAEAPIEFLFDEVSGKPFGPKIDWFKKWCDFSEIAANKKELLKQVYDQLDALKLKRDFIVHGETYVGSFRGQPRQPYRVGLVKKNLEYLDEFERGEHGDNVFTIDQVRAVTKEVRILGANLDKLRKLEH